MNPRRPPSFSSIRILLVDDAEPWRRLVCSTLEAHDHLHVVDAAADGLEAVQKAQEQQPDLILLDIGLPHLNGLEAASRISQIAPGAKIVFLTQNNDSDVIRAALSNGAQGYVVKLDAGRELLPAVAAVLRGDKFVSESASQRPASRDSALFSLPSTSKRNSFSSI